MKLAQLRKPINHETLMGNPTLFAIMPKAELNGVTIEYNILNGLYHIEGQKGRIMPYVVAGINNAMKLAKTIGHYNETGITKKFKDVNINEFKLLS